MSQPQQKIIIKKKFLTPITRIQPRNVPSIKAFPGLKEYGSLYYHDCFDQSQIGSDQKVKIAAFDMDSTLIKSKSGKIHAQDADDWQFNYPNVPTMLEDFIKKGYQILVYSNQKGVSTGKRTIAELQSKLSQIDKYLQTNHPSSQISFSVFLAIEDDNFRKPLTGSWDFLLSIHPGLEDQIDYKNSFYCGDAAGRPKGWMPGSKADISNSDRDFAFNIGFPFMTPEELFLGAKPFPITEIKSPYIIAPELDLTVYLKSPEAPLTISSKDWRKKGYKAELAMMIGPPGAGKSTYIKQFEALGYVVISQDVLKTKAKCIRTAEHALYKDRKSIVIDATNPSPEDREKYLEIANVTDPQRNEIYRRAFVMKTPYMLAQHLNGFRTQSSKGAKKRIPIIAYRIFNKRFKEPTLDEFHEIQKVPFVPNFTSDQASKEFLYHYDI